MVFTGFRELFGSCGISPIRTPRILRHCRGLSPVRLCPFSRIVPLTSALPGSRPRAARAEVDLPEPDSPTMAVVRPFATVRLMPRTAGTVPRRVR